METVSIRGLRGSDLAKRARSGELVGIENHRVLIGVVVPVTSQWLEHLIDYNWSNVMQSIAEGEQALTDGKPMVTLDSVIADADGRSEPPGASEAAPKGLAGIAAVATAAVGGTVVNVPGGKETVEQLRAAAGSPGPATGQKEGSAESAVRTVRIGDLSGHLIEEAGAAGQTLAITHDRELIGIVVPVTAGLVQYLIEMNMSRVLYNIGRGERKIADGEPLVTLDDEGQIKKGNQGDPPSPVAGNPPSPAAGNPSSSAAGYTPNAGTAQRQ
jgi:hypothetical protein